MPACDLPHLFPNVIIRASAGTGKTFQLSNRYIALAHAGERPDHILAATFARKAAGEILERVLSRLARAADDPAALDELAGHVEALFSKRPLDRAACRALLKTLIQHLHRLRVGTLDSFFVQMAGTFGLELGLPPGWRIVDETTDRQLRSQAIQEVLAGDSAAALVTLMHLLKKGHVTSSVSHQIRQAADGLYDLFRETDPEAWKAVPRPRPLADDEFQQALWALDDIDLSQQKRMATARADDVQRARSEDWPNFLGKGLAGKLAAGETTYHKVEIPGELRAAYAPLIQHAKAVLLGALADQTDATHRLLEKFHAAYQRLKIEHRALRFDDVTRTLADALGGERMDEVSFRLDAHVCQLLLDEFQDTSLAQWQVLAPFAHATSAEDARSFFCVGDVKQAIYGWRGGLSELFDAVAGTLHNLRDTPLDCSYRSSPVIIDAANAVFGGLKDNPVLADFPDVAAAWAGRFTPHTTARDEPGYVGLHTAPHAGEGEDQRTATLRFAAAEAARLHREHPGRSVGILVRTNKSVGRLIYELRHAHGIIASEEGGNALTDSAAVALVLSLLTLADHPGHTIARYHVARSPLGPLVGFEQWNDTAAARRLSLRVRESLLHDGYGRTIYGWARSLAPSCDQRELGRLQQLIELAYGYEPQATGRTVDFVSFVGTQKVEDPTAADVRVMTVHQAKGLQFDIVLLPELDVTLTGRTPTVVIGRPSPTAPIQTVCRYASKELQALLPPPLQRMFDEHRFREANEALCLLYVAMTRPVHALHLIVAPPTKRESRHTFAQILRAALCPGVERVPDSVLWEHGRRDWFGLRGAGFQPALEWDGQVGNLPHMPALDSRSETRSLRDRVSADDEPLTIRLAPSRPERRRGLERQSPSALEGGRRIKLAARLRSESTAATARGSLLHKWLEQIVWLDDGAPNDERLLEAARDMPTDNISPRDLLPHFRRLLDKPAIRAVLSRGGSADPAALGWGDDIATALRDPQIRSEVHREHPFAVREGTALLSGTIDRLVLFRRGDRIVAADVIDFKSDAIRPGHAKALAKQIERHRPQMDAYRHAVCRLFRLDPGCVATRLVFLGPGTVETVSPGAQENQPDAQARD